MNKTYYIFRHRVGVPSHLDVCLADEKNGSFTVKRMRKSSFFRGGLFFLFHITGVNFLRLFERRK